MLLYIPASSKPKNKESEIYKTMKNKEKQILKALNKNNSLYEAIYCAIVSDNDFIQDRKEDIKILKKEIKENINVNINNQLIDSTTRQLKEYQTKRKQLKRAFFLLFGDDMREYND